MLYKFSREICDRYQELASYSKLDPETEQMIRQEMQHKKRMSLREPEDDKFARKKNNKYNHKNAKHEKMIEIRDEVLTIEEIETDEEEKEYGERVVSILEEPFVEPRRAVKKRREKQILSRVCVEVCKPEICCADLEGKHPFRTTAQTSFHRVGKAIYFFFVFYASLGTSDKIMRSPLEAQRDPIIPRFLSCSAALFELAMAALCNFLSHLSTGSDNAVNKIYRGGQIDSAAKRKNAGRDDNFVKNQFRWKIAIKLRESAMSGGNIDKRSLF